MKLKENKEFKAIWYDGEQLILEVKQIPLKDLIYNKYNGRIKSAVLSFESLRGKLDATNENDRKIIENYLFESAENRNEKTTQSLRDYGQQEIGIVTNDFIIIDGNRRASLLSKLHKEGNKIDYFKAVVLPDNLDKNELEIIKLETNYQMGVDNKVEYKPIEKYLRCKELINPPHKIPVEEVAKLMGEKSSRINQWMNILCLMDEYLNYLDSPEVYTRLDKKEGHFVDLNNYLKQYPENRELKEVYFDFIRLGIPVQRARIIGNPKDNQSLYSNSNLWKPFYIEHKSIKEKLSEKTFSTLKEENPEMSNEQIFGNIDNYFIEKLKTNLVNNLVQGEIAIKELKIKNNIKIKLQEISKYIINIDINDIFSLDKIDVKHLLNSISTESIARAKQL
jgi:hypothetical protein